MSECQQRVNDLIDLRLCSDGVKASIADEDYEQAAAHLHRFLSMDEGERSQQVGGKVLKFKMVCSLQLWFNLWKKDEDSMA